MRSDKKSEREVPPAPKRFQPPAACPALARGAALYRAPADANEDLALAAEAAKSKGITRVVFDRSGARYHGKVKALAEAAREGGLQF